MALSGVALLSFYLGTKANGIAHRLHVAANYMLPQAPSAGPPSEYRSVPCPGDAIIISTFGQSNSANHIRPPSALPIPEKLYQYDWKSEKCFRYREPLLGTDGTFGNSITPAAVTIARESSRPVLIIPFGRGGTSVLEWAYGKMADRHHTVLYSLKVKGLAPSFFLWHQGESDSPPITRSAPELRADVYFQASPDYPRLGLPRNVYRDALKMVVERTLSVFPDAKFGIALASRCRSPSSAANVRNAQQDVINQFPNAFLSVDSDAIWGVDVRYDGCHFNDRGSAAISEAYMRSMKNVAP